MKIKPFPIILLSLVLSGSCSTRTEELPTPDTVNFELLSYTSVYKIEFIDAYHGMMATNSEVYFTVDGGQTWNFSLQVSNSVVSDICYPKLDTAYAFFTSGSNGPNVVYRTYDHGATWTSPSSFGAHVISPFFVSGQKGFVWLDESPDHMYRTLNWAQNWLTLGAQGVRKQLRFINENLGFAIDNNYSLTRTLSGGNLWTVEFSNGTVVDYTLLPSLGKVFLTTDDGRIFRSDDNGDNFTEIYNDADNLGVSQVTAYSNGLVVAGWRGWLVISHDFGNTWETRALNDENVNECYFYSLTAIQPNVVIATGSINNQDYIGKITIP